MTSPSAARHNPKPTCGGCGGPLLLRDPEANPQLWDANHVYLPYMTGDFHAGQRCAAGDLYAGKYWFCGHRHLEATIGLGHTNSQYQSSTLYQLYKHTQWLFF